MLPPAVPVLAAAPPVLPSLPSNPFALPPLLEAPIEEKEPVSFLGAVRPPSLFASSSPFLTPVSPKAAAPAPALPVEAVIKVLQEGRASMELAFQSMIDQLRSTLEGASFQAPASPDLLEIPTASFPLPGSGVLSGPTPASAPVVVPATTETVWPPVGVTTAPPVAPAPAPPPQPVFPIYPPLYPVTPPAPEAVLPALSSPVQMPPPPAAGAHHPGPPPTPPKLHRSPPRGGRRSPPGPPPSPPCYFPQSDRGTGFNAGTGLFPRQGSGSWTSAWVGPGPVRSTGGANRSPACVFADSMGGSSRKRLRSIPSGFRS